MARVQDVAEILGLKRPDDGAPIHEKRGDALEALRDLVM
jgi:hypothetical protein